MSIFEGVPSTHQAKVIRVEQVLPHQDVDRLEIVPVGGFQAVAQKDKYKVGELAIFILPVRSICDGLGCFGGGYVSQGFF